MPSLTKYWMKVVENENSLPGTFSHVTSIENEGREITGGVVFLVNNRHAAQLMTDGTHRISTPEEIAAYELTMQKRAWDLSQEEARRHNKTLPQEMMQQIVAAAIVAARSSGELTEAKLAEIVAQALKESSAQQIHQGQTTRPIKPPVASPAPA